ncbi:DUF916 and DUF3324 domain-containing protein [Listeria costaricensis]|uniref:DUF916 and DUF3324 domain-containing protein n=1 Tax=Listeria costaricensis TaxID=2026604 RepID=UPI000C07E748|nr:DUF916 and DUF3324 domain-containing protein [Listeria costaricensis]
MLKQRKGFFIGLLILAVNFWGIGVEASGTDFSVQAILPDNQLSNGQTYFDLLVKAGETQTLQVQLSNGTEQEKTIAIAANSAVTNNNGQIEYTLADPKLDPTLQYPFATLAAPPEEVTLSGGETKTVDIPVQIPTEPFSGIILGGLYFTEKNPPKHETKQENVQFDNQFSYTIGVVLQEDTAAVEPFLKLQKVAAGQKNGRNTVFATIQNPQAAIVRDLKVKAAIYRKGDSKPLHEATAAQLKMAPNSRFDFPISWEDQPFEPGTYKLKLTAATGTDQWNWEKSFTIKKDRANHLNQQAAELEPETRKQHLPLYLTAGFLLLLGVFFLGRLSSKRKNNH